MQINEPQHPDEHELATLFDDCHCRKLANNELLSLPQSQQNQVFYLRSGRLRVYLCYGDKLFTLTILQPGDVYSTHTRAFVEALEPSQVNVMELHSFAKRAAAHPQLTGAVTRVLSQTLSGCIDTIENLVFRDVRARLASYLLAQVAQPAEQPLVELRLTTEQTAQLIGTSRQTLSSLLSELQRQGLVQKLSRNQWRLCNCRQLSHIAAL
ncbi:Crp/Fnr family transcriptional regulator [Shewanella mangrovi]|uniref:Crp/Fnr family transcriptional regulator n=1 Tax=Shewanella mangrovi TaxID=1515746 RepID=UPI00068B8783|nr:Crp/Fnr family transcriptional regulator [Shewanella mangrovi]